MLRKRICQVIVGGMSEIDTGWIVIPQTAIEGTPKPSPTPSDAVKMLRRWQTTMQFKSIGSKISLAVEHYPTGRVVALMEGGQTIKFSGSDV